MNAVSINEIKKLSVAQRIILVEKIWETIPEKSDDLALMPDQEKELNRRIKSIENGTAKFVSWDYVRKCLRERRYPKTVKKIATLRILKSIRLTNS